MPDSMDLLNKLTVANLLLDNRMAILKAKIFRKREEIARLEDEIRREQSDLVKVEQELADAKTREDIMARTVHGLQESKSMLSNLKSTLERGISSAREGLNRVACDRKVILDKYRRASESHRTAYESLRTYRAITSKRAERSHLQILVKKCRFDFDEYKAKVAMLKNISVLRLNRAVIEFAELMVRRNNIDQKQRMDHLSQEMEALAKSGVTLTLRKVPVKTTFPSFTPIRERLGVKSVFTSSIIWDEGGSSFREEFTPQAASSQNPLEYNFPTGTSISVVSPTINSAMDASKGSPFFKF